jgi:predicted amidohydrolase
MVRPLRLKTNLVSSGVPGVGAGLRIALYQGEGPVGSAEAVAANLARMDEVAEMAARYGSHVCVFPEKFNTGYAIGVEQCRELAEPYDGPSIDAARTVAKTHGLTVVLPYPERDGDCFYDSIAVADHTGQLVANYRKTHLYGAAERRNYSFGQELPPLLYLNGITVGVLNCYECEFPPLYQYLAEQGARVVIGPTAADFRLFRYECG